LLAQRTNQNPITYTPPKVFVKESEKTPEWFASYARWAVRTFYNQSISPFQPITGVRVGIADECIENWRYIKGEQSNNQFAYLTQDFSNNDIPATWIPGQKIQELYKHLSGVILGSIENIEVTAKNLSEHVASERSKIYDKLIMGLEINDLINQTLPPNIKFDPINDPDADLSTKEDIKKYAEKWQDKYSIIGERIGRSQIYQDDLKAKYLQDAQNQIAGGISAMLTEVVDGKVVNTVYPNYEIIWDNRDNDPWNNNAMLCGFVKHSMPYEEFIAKFQDELTSEDIEEIRQMAMAANKEVLDDFLNYYNSAFGNGRYMWWNDAGTQNMTITYATVYFLAPEDYRYKNGKNAKGKAVTFEIEDNKTYEGVKGYEVSGDYSGWSVYQVTLAGNKYILNYGKMPNQVRPYDVKSKPMLPMRIFCSDMSLGYGKSIVSRLKQNQNLLDAYAYKIQDKVAADWGKNYIFNGAKLTGTDAVQIANELKRLHVTIGVPSGEPGDPTDASRMVESIDQTLDANIIRYIELRAMVKEEMEETVSVSRIALGQQQNTVGKGVQQNTINQNSYGTATLMWGMMKHFNNIMQYNVNLKQMQYLFKEGAQEELVIGDEGSEVLDILDPQEFGTQKLLTYIEIGSVIDQQMKENIRTIALSEAQNGRLDTVDYIDYVLLADTAKQTVSGLRYARSKQEQKLSQQQQASTEAQMQHEAALKDAENMSKAILEQLKQNNENWRKLADIMKDNPAMANLLAGTQPPISPALTEMEQADQPPMDQPVEEQIQ
jgi:hypothetical protein